MPNESSQVAQFKARLRSCRRTIVDLIEFYTDGPFFSKADKVRIFDAGHKWLIAFFRKPHLLAKMALFGIFAAKFLGHVYPLRN